GERHNIETENERRLIKRIAENIATILGKAKVDEWNLAAGVKINSAILQELSPEIKEKLTRNLKSNLINASKAELVERFQ
ncbi:MAG: host attachment protein, partial [candidate division Zixibacteria bacterium]|nr:host attachment protein [candidate division Zixibacteria bacterium]NIT52827.1 host attachment protein [candidate division Zixibacteria bacterium]NIU15597.1 host attachment protein [candidate division Zixibacteria bacterium]NIV07742.1 hypothetical protein [candidate division Zixibacteria bacterium]NIX58895.1 hypothetical protein [candidate division Zixibacteria bacterium]